MYKCDLKTRTYTGTYSENKTLPTEPESTAFRRYTQRKLEYTATNKKQIAVDVMKIHHRGYNSKYKPVVNKILHG